MKGLEEESSSILTEMRGWLRGIFGIDWLCLEVVDFEDNGDCCER